VTQEVLHNAEAAKAKEIMRVSQALPVVHDMINNILRI
jgi:hypothetical protein